MSKPLPIAVELLWERQAAGTRGPAPKRSIQEIVKAAVAIADAEGLEAVTMARVARALGFTTMALYRYVPNKGVLLQLMWNVGAEDLADAEIAGDTWRERLRHWALAQRQVLEDHPWLAQMPVGHPPLAPNALRWQEMGLAAFDGTNVPYGYRMQVLGIFASYGLADARLVTELREASIEAGKSGVDLDFGSMLREIVDPEEFPHVHAMAHSGQVDGSVPLASDAAVAAYETDVELILDGVETLIARFAGP